MKLKLILSVLLISFSLSFIAQDSSHVKLQEFYISISGFSPLNTQLRYKHQVGLDKFLKIGLVDLSVSNTKGETTTSNTVFPTEYTNYSAGLELGFEFRIGLAKRLALFHGPNLRYTYINSQSVLFFPGQDNEYQKSTVVTQRFSLPYSFGLLFSLTPNLLLSAEINPDLYYRVSDYTIQNSSTNNSSSANESFGVNISNAALLSLVIRF